MIGSYNLDQSRRDNASRVSKPTINGSVLSNNQARRPACDKIHPVASITTVKDCGNCCWAHRSYRSELISRYWLFLEREQWISSSVDLGGFLRCCSSSVVQSIRRTRHCRTTSAMDFTGTADGWPVSEVSLRFVNLSGLDIIFHAVSGYVSRWKCRVHLPQTCEFEWISACPSVQD